MEDIKPIEETFNELDNTGKIFFLTNSVSFALFFVLLSLKSVRLLILTHR